MRRTHTAIQFLTLLTSSSTLFCCALPALLVTIGAGASMVGLVTAVPQLTLLSAYKPQLFLFSGVMLLIAGVLHYRQRYTSCPVNPEAAKACGKARRIGLRIYGFSLAIYLTGFSFAYVIPRFM